jgi:plastocyanin domain-containing protein
MLRDTRPRLRAVALLAALALAACRGGSGPIELKVTKNGFDPALVRVARGRPVELLITRTTDETCATEIVIPEAGVNVPLPLGQPVKVVFTPSREGRLKFSCAMGMFGGVIEVR